MHTATDTPLLAYLPVGVPSVTNLSTSIFPHTYSLYPFLPSRPLPWYLNSTGAFRVRRVGEWVGRSLGEEIEHTGGLAGEKGRILTVAQYALSQLQNKHNLYHI